MKAYAAALALVCIVPTVARSQARHVVKPATGLTCMALRVTEAQALDPKFIVPFYAEPSAASPVVGRAIATVLVRSPLTERNGFLQGMVYNGQVGWVSARALKPWVDPSGRGGRCVPSVMSDGRLGVDIK